MASSRWNTPLLSSIMDQGQNARRSVATVGRAAPRRTGHGARRESARSVRHFQLKDGPGALLAHPPGAVTGTARTALLRFRSAIA